MVAAGKSPKLKRQPESKFTTVRAEAVTRLDGSTGSAGSAAAREQASNPRTTEKENQFIFITGVIKHGVFAEKIPVCP
jgi:hypothetical protein